MAAAAALEVFAKGEKSEWVKSSKWSAKHGSLEPEKSHSPLQVLADVQCTGRNTSCCYPQTAVDPAADWGSGSRPEGQAAHLRQRRGDCSTRSRHTPLATQMRRQCVGKGGGILAWDGNTCLLCEISKLIQILGRIDSLY